MPLDAAELKIVRYPAEVLRTRAKPIDAVDETVRAVAGRMLELMAEAEGAGLAASQVGLSWRMFVTRAQSEDDPGRVYINPILTITNPELVVHEEGCLSLPEIHVDIRRPKGVRLNAIGLDGKPLEVTSEEFIARVWQHEMDHLNGVLIIDKMTPIDRLATRKAIKELEAAAATKADKDNVPISWQAPARGAAL
jgi:peptide deformylase